MLSEGCAFSGNSNLMAKPSDPAVAQQLHSEAEGFRPWTMLSVGCAFSGNSNLMAKPSDPAVAQQLHSEAEGFRPSSCAATAF
jgi:hypothetical protein